MKKILKTYLNRLTNLSGNNRSILLLKLSSDFLDLNEVNFENGESSFTVIQNLIARKNAIPLTNAIDSRDGNTNELSNKLKKIYRQDKFITEERGSKDLYLGWPFIKGKLMDGSSVRAPLIFFPVELELANNKWILSPRKDENIVLNKSFLLAYSYFNQVTLSEDLIDKQLDDWNKDPQVFRNELYTLIKENELAINFNQDLFIDKLVPFTNYKKDYFDGVHTTGELKLFSEAVLGIFPQADSNLVPDYNYLLEHEEFEDLEELFLRKTNSSAHENRNSLERFNYLHKVKEEHTITPFDIDASQENSIKAVKLGNSMVVQGPPGSGKSQLICNLIADSIAGGKKVLMVCQKRVALDVVYQRLKSEGIADFIALVHDFRHDRRSVYNQIQNQIEKLDEFQAQNNNFDTIYLERSFLQASRRIDQLSEELEGFKEALFDTEECGVSIKVLYLTSDKDKEIFDISKEYKHFTFDNLDSFVTALKYYLSYAENFERENYPWKERKSFADLTIADENNIKNILNEIPPFTSNVTSQASLLSGRAFSFEDFDKIAQEKELIFNFLKECDEKEVFDTLKEIVEVSQENFFWLERIEKRLLQSFEKEGLEITLDIKQLGQFQEALTKASSAFESPFSMAFWKLFSKDRFLIKRTLVANKLKANKKGIEILTNRFDNRLNLEHNLSDLRKKTWLSAYPEKHFQIFYQSWFYRYKQAFKLLEKYSSFGKYLSLDLKSIDLPHLKKRLSDLVALTDLVQLKKKDWLEYLHANQLNRILDDQGYLNALTETLDKDFDALCEYDQTFKAFDSTESTIINKLLDWFPDSPAEEMVGTFLNSLKIKWIEHIEQRYPILRSVSTQKLRQMEEELQDKVKEKTRLSKEILLLKLREKTFKDLEVNRLNNLVSYRDLSHQVTKKRMIWPIRKLLSAHADEIFKLVPCWLASPETVSSIFPMESYFDLVIFDEASQCFAEHGIPSIYRGKQVVITGDNKQLTPNDIYKSRWDEQDEDIPETQLDSLLELGGRYLLQTQLTGHYRSRSLELIDFSNQNFYKGKLSLLPDFDHVNQEKPPIEYIKTSGIWDKNTNTVEAQKVIELVFELIKDKITEIGIVTFNFSQQTLIQNLLEEQAAIQNIRLPESLFIKNIENVQGDERDVIIFSTAYAPDAKGRMSMNFGSLNARGGENRLNVAITRARKKIMIVTSIFPEQLSVEESKHSGPKLFKKYLEYALNVSQGNYDNRWKTDFNLPFEGILKHKLVSMLPNSNEKIIQNALPFSDLVVSDATKLKGVILTDDELYHQSISIKDTHVYKKSTLKSKNWKFIDFYSREYWNNKDEVAAQYLNFKESLP